MKPWVLLTTAAFTLMPIVSAQAATFDYSVPLEPGQEVPPSSSSASGMASGTLNGNPDSWTFSYEIDYSELEAGLAAGHIHFGDFGTNGPVVHPLDGIDSLLGTTSGTIIGDWTSAEVDTDMSSAASVYDGLIAGDYYFNLHSTAFPSGEIRGQIEPLVENVASTPEPNMWLGIIVGGCLTLVRRRSKVTV